MVTYEELYAAFYKAAVALGSDIKKLSWFGRNHKKLTVVEDQE